jgi:hypothetical protein
MAGIVSYGAYIPLRRLGPGTRGWTLPSEKAVANYATSFKNIGNIGGEMDLAFGAARFIVVMTHTYQR